MSEGMTLEGSLTRRAPPGGAGFLLYQVPPPAQHTAGLTCFRAPRPTRLPLLSTIVGNLGEATSITSQLCEPGKVA